MIQKIKEAEAAKERLELGIPVPAKAAKATQKKPKKKGANFCDEEDVLVCRSFKSMTLNNIMGSGKKSNKFWQECGEKYNLLVDDIGPSRDKNLIHHRDHGAIQNRWSRVIMPQMNKFLPYLRAAKIPVKSGYDEAKYIADACEQYKEDNDREFAFCHVIEVLSDLAKFDSKITAKEAEELENENLDATNNNVPPMGAGLDRPQGSKAAKSAAARQISQERVEAKRQRSLDAIASGQFRMAEAANRSARTSNLNQRALMFERRGNFQEADRILEEIRQLDEQWALDDAAKEAEMMGPARRNSLENSLTSVLEAEDEQLPALGGGEPRAAPLDGDEPRAAI